MKKDLFWISIGWICMILLGGLFLMVTWNLAATKLFGGKEISYLTATLISLALGLFKRGRMPRTCTAARDASRWTE